MAPTTSRNGQFNKDGIRSAAIHGNKSQESARPPARAGDFKSGGNRVLVAAGCRPVWISKSCRRGELRAAERAGRLRTVICRTGRAATGVALSLVCVDEQAAARYRAPAEKREIPRIAIAGMSQTSMSIKAEPKRRTVASSVRRSGKSRTLAGSGRWRTARSQNNAPRVRTARRRARHQDGKPPRRRSPARKPAGAVTR